MGLVVEVMVWEDRFMEAEVAVGLVAEEMVREDRFVEAEVVP